MQWEICWLLIVPRRYVICFVLPVKQPLSEFVVTRDVSLQALEPVPGLMPAHGVWHIRSFQGLDFLVTELHGQGVKRRVQM